MERPQDHKERPRDHREREGTSRGPPSSHLCQDSRLAGEAFLNPPDKLSDQLNATSDLSAMWNTRPPNQALPKSLTPQIMRFNKMVAVMNHCFQSSFLFCF